MAVRLYQNGDRQRVVGVQAQSDGQERYRTPWRRDYARLIHSAAFRRLQGKTQLYPSHESDFFRNRLTHSLEVAQVAKSIAIRLNATNDFFKPDSKKIDTDLVETAALAHDLGHPPFGHNGEEALDECMREHGGFEGNAQTLRILSKLEKRQTVYYEDKEPIRIRNGQDTRVGLNLTYRTLAAVLKYDKMIARQNSGRSTEDQNSVTKGYYYTEKDLIDKIKEHVAKGHAGSEFKTIECSIMDIADDIAYSTYDLEDSFKARFTTPLGMISADKSILDNVAKTVRQRLNRYYPEAALEEKDFTTNDVYHRMIMIFSKIYDVNQADYAGMDLIAAAAGMASSIAAMSDRTASDGYFRTQFTSDLVGLFIRNVHVRPNETYPALSRAYLDIETFKTVEVLKNFAYQALIMSSMLKVSEHRGKDIIKRIFEALSTPKGFLLMPEDFRYMYTTLYEPDEKKRVICDFIAGMTDRYAVQFYGRLFGTDPETMYSPL
jgi:dGTPase